MPPSVDRYGRAARRQLVARRSRGQYSFMDAAAKKTVLRQFPYGLYVVTVAHGGEEHGMAATWVTQAAFAAPMVAVAVEKAARKSGRTVAALHCAHNPRPHILR